MKQFIPLLASLLFLFTLNLHSQCLIPATLTKQGEKAMTTPILNHNMSARRDSSASKPYLYVAAKAQGLQIYNISSLSLPVFAASVAVSALNNLDVNSVTQSGNYLFLALGDIFSKTAQNSGMAIVNITNPNSPTVTSVYTFSATSGTGFVAVEGSYAYLAAMQNGLIVLDVTNKSAPVFVSRIIPNVNFPKNAPNATELDKINARSMVVKNSIVYLCYDAGGLRIINATTKTNLKETGRYSNPALLTRPRAYNNLVLNDSLVYVACDYAGMEVLKIKDTANISLTGWWNPWNAHLTSNTWFNSPGHTNEIEFDAGCKMLFMSAGKSDLMAVSVANPALPDSCSQYGSKLDSSGTWGLGKYQNQIYLCYISTWPLYIPFRSEWSGVKILTYNNACFTGINEFKKENSFTVYPNPASQELFVKSENENGTLVMYNLIGEIVLKTDVRKGENKLNIAEINTGSYFYKIKSTEGTVIKTGKLIVMN
ncbi:MAG: T9SS type A sorting domain-containing protein [Sphingobacteriaceae bacterium]|nr:T9SS type A sorting domain-containing protein [Sphingobacteriaceae bacterium]